MAASGPRLLILETSGRVGQVALACGSLLLRSRRLDEARRHARDLTPAVAELLAVERWKPRDLSGLIVSRGPGSYTGLRVGLMSAKAFVYATGCTLIAVDTFAAIARQVPEEVTRVDVLADAQQEKIYIQQFARSENGREFDPVGKLAIQQVSEWFRDRDESAWVTGPGLNKFKDQLPASVLTVAATAWDPQPESLLHLGLTRYWQGDRDDFRTLEPLYLRASSAEEKWDQSKTKN